MRRKLFKRRQEPIDVKPSPHYTAKVEEPKKPSDEKIQEFRDLGRRPYRNGELTKGFLSWYDDNKD